MPKINISNTRRSIKHDIISSDNNKMIIAVSVAAFIVIFSLFAIKALLSQRAYQSRVIAAKEKARNQLETNVDSLEQLNSRYNSFKSETVNIIGGKPSGTGDRDGSNTTLVLDALPDKYDFPALSSSIEKILKQGGYQVESVGGEEDAQLAALTAPSGESVPTPMPFNFKFNSSYDGSKKLLTTLESSIRPMYVDRLEISVSENGIISNTINMHTFFAQPKTFELKQEVVK